MNKQIHHCFIAPINYLSYIPETSKYHLLLAHLLENEIYCNYYKKRKEVGDFIIIDNGAYEFKRPLQAEELYRLINTSGITPDIVVAPDYPFESWDKTVKSTESFAKEYQKYFGSDVKIMAVPQSIKGDCEGWIKGYKELAMIDNVDWIGMSILGIPNAFCQLTGTEDISFNRIYATILLKERNLQAARFHHYLGLGSSVRELLIQKELGLMFSNDSSSAIWHGIKGIRYDNSTGGIPGGKLNEEVNFDIMANDNPFIVESIQYNVKFIQELCNAEVAIETPSIEKLVQ